MKELTAWYEEEYMNPSDPKMITLAPASMSTMLELRTMVFSDFMVSTQITARHGGIIVMDTDASPESNNGSGKSVRSNVDF